MATDARSKSSISLDGFSSLPLELQVMILQLALIDDPSEYLTYLGDGEAERLPLESKREQLKRIRLMGRAFCEAVNPAVFASIHISASRSSLQRAENIANSSFAGYVREIVYHEGGFADRNTDLKLFLSTLASHRRRQDYPIHLKKIKGTDLHANFLAEIDEAQSFEGFNTPRWTAILHNLPNLETYVCLPYNNEWHDPETSAYTLRRVGLSYLPMEHFPVTHRTLDLIVANRSIKIKELNLSLFPSFARGYLVSYHPSTLSISPKDDNEDTTLTNLRSWLQNLRHLKVGADHSPKYGQPLVSIKSWNIDVDRFLIACEGLTHLEITYGFAIHSNNESRDPLLPPGCLPRLQSLTLSNETFLPEMLKGCLLGLASSLRHLKFDNVSFQTVAWFNQGSIYESSIVELLYDVSPSMKLRTCVGLDTVRCCKTDKRGLTMSGYKPGKEVMVRKVQEAVCRQRTWPKSITDTTFESGVFPNREQRATFFFSNWNDMVDLFEETSYDWNTVGCYYPDPSVIEDYAAY